MKKLLLLLPILTFSVTAFSQWKTIPKKGGDWYYTASIPIPVNPGDTVSVESEYGQISLNDVHGLPGKPIVFIRKGTRAKVGAKTLGNAIITQRCSYLVFDGFEVGNANLDDTSFSAQGWNIQSSHNIEIRNSIVKNAEIGFFTNPAEGHFANIYIHDCEIYNISDKKKRSFCEAFYIGRTSGQTPAINSFPNLRIENNYVHDIGGDGIQIANGLNVLVKGNRMRNIRLHKINDQWFSYLCGGGTSGVFEDNYTENGQGTPFQILGTGEVVFRNNTAINCAQGDRQDGFYIRQSFPTLKVRLIGNKIDKVNRSYVTQVTPGLVIEEIGNVYGGTIIPPINPPVVRVDSVTKASYDSLMANYQVAVQLINACVSLREECYRKNKELNLTIDSLNAELVEKKAWIESTIKYVNRK